MYFVFVLCCQFNNLGPRLFLCYHYCFVIIITNFFLCFLCYTPYCFVISSWVLYDRTSCVSFEVCLISTNLCLYMSELLLLVMKCLYPCPIFVCTDFPLSNLILVIQNFVYHRKAWRLLRE